MRVVKGQEWTALPGRSPRTVRVLKVIKGPPSNGVVAQVENVKTSRKELVKVDPGVGLVGFGLTAPAPKKAPKVETAKDFSRMPKGSTRGPNVMMDTITASAYAFVLKLVQDNPGMVHQLKTIPAKGLPANQSGAFCLAFRECAALHGWVEPAPAPAPPVEG